MTGISNLFVESHTKNFEEIFEGVSLLFDDNFIIIVIPYSLYLDIEIQGSPHPLDFSCFYVEFDHNYVVDHSILKTPTQFLEA